MFSHKVYGVMVNTTKSGFVFRSMKEFGRS